MQSIAFRVLAIYWQGDDPFPPKKGHSSRPLFSPCLLRPNGWMDQDTTWYEGKPRPRPHCVRCGLSSPPSKGHSPQFSAHVCCGQTTGWIKMLLSREVDLGRGDIVLDRNQVLPSPKGAQQPPPVFGPCLLWPNGHPSQLLLSSCIFV